MKLKTYALVLLLAGAFAGCGSSPKLRAITLAPNPAGSSSSPARTSRVHRNWQYDQQYDSRSQLQQWSDLGQLQHSHCNH
jgi:hypothetical protein